MKKMSKKMKKKAESESYFRGFSGRKIEIRSKI